ncbi:MAG TPA: hypothetical protein DDZ51_03515 [Planctomycetaceae bacterium]|nr:hypothetical protein [Planctomycetaceae bacterium]
MKPHTTFITACFLAFCSVATSPCLGQSSNVAPTEAAAPTPKPIDPMTWVAAAQDLRIAAQTAEQIIDKVGNTIEQTMVHVAQASHGFDPLGLKAAMETVRQQNETIREQNETIRGAMKAENRRLQRENRRLKKALRKAHELNGDAPQQ